MRSDSAAMRREPEQRGTLHVCCSKGHSRRDRSCTPRRAESGQLEGTAGDQECDEAWGANREEQTQSVVAGAPGFVGPRGEESGGRPRFKRFERGSAVI